MSRVDDLIRELCPDGVPFKALGECGEFIHGNGMQKSDLRSEGFPAIHYGQIHTTYGTSAAKTVSFVSPASAEKLRRARPGDLLVVTTSEDDDAVGKATAWVGDTEVALSGDAFIYHHALEPKYVAYFFQSEQFQIQKKRYITGAKVRRISGESLAKIMIPVPPVEVQREIVQVLDLFESLEAELEAELEARRRQYAYYRGRLLTFRKTSGVRWAPLGDVARVRYGQDFPRAVQGRLHGRYPFYKVIDMSLRGNETVMSAASNYVSVDDLAALGVDLAPVGTILMPRVGAAVTTNRKRLLGVPAAFDTSFIALVPSEAVSPRFLLYLLQGIDLVSLSNTGAALPSVRRVALERLLIPVPPLDEQWRIIAVLDKFDALVNDLSVGLPAELAARRQQYAHYRDRLLTFAPAA